MPRHSEVRGDIKFQELNNSTNNSLRGLSPNPRLSDLNEASVNEHPSSQVQLFHPRSLENLQEVHTYVSISLSVYLIYLSVYLSLFPSTDRSIYLSIYLLIDLFLYLSIYLSIDRFISLSIYLSINLSTHFSIMYPSKYLSFFLPIVNTFPFALFPSYPAFHRRRYPPPFQTKDSFLCLLTLPLCPFVYLVSLSLSYTTKLLLCVFFATGCLFIMCLISILLFF